MAPKAASERSTSDPREELAQWTGLRQKYSAEYEILLKERKNEILTLQIDHGPRSDAYKVIQREQDRNDGQFDRIQAVVRRPVNKLNILPWVFWLLALALALFEAPVNKFLFDYAIQGSNLTSYLISTVFAVLLLLLGHLGGKCFRQVWSEYRRRVVWSNLIIALMACVVLVILICILTIGRARYSAGAGDPGIGGLFTDIGGQVSEHGIWNSLVLAFTDVSALVLFTVNLGAVVCAMLLGFFSHDPDKDLDQAEGALLRSRQQVRSIQRRYAKSRARVIRKFAPDLTGASRNYADANNRVVQYKTLLGMPLDEWDRFVPDQLDELAEEAAENEDAHRLAGSRVTDESFRSEPELAGSKVRPIK